VVIVPHFGAGSVCDREDRNSLATEKGGFYLTSGRLTATSPEMWGPTIPELTEALPGISIINRTTVNAFDEPRFAKAVEATWRKKLIICRNSLLRFPSMAH